MIIANPISDLVFKWLMSNDRIARFFLETLLEQEIVDVQLKPQELSYFNKEDDVSLSAALTVMRLDFVATIKTASGEHKKVLIEIQKARNTIDVKRFRKYLAEHLRDLPIQVRQDLRQHFHDGDFHAQCLHHAGELAADHAAAHDQ